MTIKLIQLAQILLFFTFFYNSSYAQDYRIFQDLEVDIFNEADLFISPEIYRPVHFNAAIFNQKTSNIPNEVNTKVTDSPVILTFPLPDGTEKEFKVVEYSMMQAGLAESFPNIKTYLGVGVKNPLETVRFDYSSHGLRAVLRLENEMVYIDPASKNNSENSICYYRKDLINEDVHACQVTNVVKEEIIENHEFNSLKSGACGLRRYMLAMATTGEYSAFFGATSATDEALVLSAVTTSINRVNEIFERDLGIRLVLIDNTEVLFYYDGATDPYTNDDPSDMLDENQTNITTVIGNSNYDIGHVVSTSAGGIASVNSPCLDGYKAKGVTGLGSPVGDGFDIDYLCHEIGHQFGAMHTFNNSCSNNVNWDTAVEPGSGSTIMGYAGTCSPNIQSNSDAYFHAVSMSQINAFVNGSTGSSCSTIISSANNQPEAEAGADVVIPRSTPFYLAGSGSDTDGDILTFCWEQMDNDSSAQSPADTSLLGPTFRTYLPSTDSVRYFPNLADLSSGGATTWEILPAVSRDLNFRMTVRDNSSASAGCYAFDDMVVSVDSTAGPFVVNTPNTTGITWTEGDRQTVTWDVANTDAAPISCAKVDILLSYDGGLSYPTTLVRDVDNDGSIEITVPEGTTTAGRIMVKSVGNVFFDISDNDFTISAGSSDFSLAISNPEENVCAGDDAIYDVTVGSISAFSESILLSVSDAPTGVSVSFSANPVSPGETIQLTMTGTSSPPVADYTMTLNGSSITEGTSSMPKNIDFYMNLGTKPGNTIQVSPTNNEENISLRPTFTWNTATNANAYELQVSTDPSFSTINQVEETSGTTLTLSEDLESVTDYFWRIRATANCGGGDWSIPLRFSTHYCTTYVQDEDLTVNDGGDVFSNLTINEAGTVSSIEVLDVIGSHTWVEDITATLISPDDTEVVLWSNLCNSRNDFSLSLKDNAPNLLADVTCDPLGGGDDYQPEEPLANFSSDISPTSTQGDWRLKLNDNWGGDPIVGVLQNWSLKICIANFAPSAEDAADAALPLELLNFEVRAQERNILLDWEAIHERDISAYEVERRIFGGENFEGIGFVDVKNNSNSRNTYQFADEEVEKGVVYQYRLRMLDYSGGINYSEIKEAKISEGGVTMNVYPNPTRGVVSVDIWSVGQEKIELEIINIAGQKIAYHKLQSGNNTIDLSSFSAGVYLLKLVGGQNFIQQKLVIN